VFDRREAMIRSYPYSTSDPPKKGIRGFFSKKKKKKIFYQNTPPSSKSTHDVEDQSVVFLYGNFPEVVMGVCNNNLL